MRVDFKNVREDLGKTIFQMATLAGVSIQTICNLENGAYENTDAPEMTGRVRRGLARAYGVDPVTGEPAAQSAAPPAPAPDNSSAIPAKTVSGA